MPTYKAYGPHNAVAQCQKTFMSPTRRGFCSSDGSERFEFGICRTVFCQILGSVSKPIIRIGISNCNNAPNSPEFGYARLGDLGVPVGFSNQCKVSDQASLDARWAIEAEDRIQGFERGELGASEASVVFERLGKKYGK